MKTKAELKAYHKEWRRKNRDRWNAYGRKWNNNNREKKKKNDRKWNRENPDKVRAKALRWDSAHPGRKAELQRVRLLKYKTLIVEAYGGCCACCGETEITFLTVEHLNKDGMAHRDVRGNFYGYLVRENFPQDGLTILCMNCNWAERNGTPCPHKTGRSVST